MYRKYFVYLDDGQNVYRLAIPAASEEAAAAACNGNGTVVAVMDVTDRFPIDEESVRTALQDFNMSEDARNFICRALADIGITD